MFGSEESFKNPVSTAMVTDLSFVNVDEPVEKLLPIFDNDFVAIVKDGDKFLGLITRVDLLYYLRRRADA